MRHAPSPLPCLFPRQQFSVAFFKFFSLLNGLSFNSMHLSPLGLRFQVFCPLPYALCPMPYSLCANYSLLYALFSLPYALCPMRFVLCHIRYALITLYSLLYALCSMPFPSALCSLLFAPCSLPFTLCPMLSALCSMRSAPCAMHLVPFASSATLLFPFDHAISSPFST